MKATMRRPPSAPEPVKAPFLYIATPCYGGALYMTHVAALCTLRMSLHASGIKHVWDPLGNESLITRARNKCVAAFLKTECTHLVFLDADVGFSHKDIATMVRANFDVTVGAYPMKRIGWGNVAQAAKDGTPIEELEAISGLYAVNPHVKDIQSGEVELLEREGARFLRVDDGATGFMVIRREVIERFIERYRKDIAYVTDYEPVGETHHMVFQADRDPVALKAGQPARYLSEDYWFCRMWQAMGGQVHLMLDAKLTHTGMHVFKGDVAKLFEVKEEDEEEPEFGVNRDVPPAILVAAREADMLEELEAAEVKARQALHAAEPDDGLPVRIVDAA